MICFRLTKMLRSHRSLAQDTITGLLLAGIGNVERGKKNFLVVDTSAFIVYSHASILTSHRDPSVGH
jgi:hypothetical protein